MYVPDCTLLLTTAVDSVSYWLQYSDGGWNSKNNLLLGSRVHVALSYIFQRTAFKSGGLIQEANVQLVLPWSKHADLCKGLGTRHGLVGSAGKYVNRFLILEFSPPPYFIRKQFSLSNIFFLCKLYNRTQLVLYSHICWYSVAYKLLHKNMPNGQKTQLKQNYQIRLADAYIIHVCLHCV